MKRILKTVISLIMATLLCSSLIGCVLNKENSSQKPSIVFDQKYNLSDCFLVFHSDHTGYFEIHFNYQYPLEEKYNYSLSGRVDFTWRVADDNTVYIFKTKETHFDDHTEGKQIQLTTFPISFGEDFLICLTSRGTVNRYILEGSDLEKAIETESY